MNVTGINNYNTNFGKICFSKEAETILKKRLSPQKYAKLKERAMNDTTNATINIYQYHSWHDRLAAYYEKDGFAEWYGAESRTASMFLSPERFINKCIKHAKKLYKNPNN